MPLLRAGPAEPHHQRDHRRDHRPDRDRRPGPRQRGGDTLVNVDSERVGDRWEPRIALEQPLGEQEPNRRKGTADRPGPADQTPPPARRPSVREQQRHEHRREHEDQEQDPARPTNPGHPRQAARPREQAVLGVGVAEAAVAGQDGGREEDPADRVVRPPQREHPTHRDHHCGGKGPDDALDVVIRKRVTSQPGRGGQPAAGDREPGRQRDQKPRDPPGPACPLG